MYEVQAWDSLNIQRDKPVMTVTRQSRQSAEIAAIYWADAGYDVKIISPIVKSTEPRRPESTSH
jgi:hypothetical protein